MVTRGHSQDCHGARPSSDSAHAVAVCALLLGVRERGYRAMVVLRVELGIDCKKAFLAGWPIGRLAEAVWLSVIRH